MSFRDLLMSAICPKLNSKKWTIFSWTFNHRILIFVRKIMEKRFKISSIMKRNALMKWIKNLMKLSNNLRRHVITTWLKKKMNVERKLSNSFHCFNRSVTAFQILKRQSQNIPSSTLSKQLNSRRNLLKNEWDVIIFRFFLLLL